MSHMQMTNRAIRVDDQLWEATLERARANGDTVSAVVRAAMRAYIAPPESQTADVIVAGIEGRAIVRTGLADVRAWSGHTP
jgi:hypothetical protein